MLNSFRTLSVAQRGYTAILRQLKLLTADAFSVQEENDLENIFSYIFRRFHSRFDIHSCDHDHTGGYAVSISSLFRAAFWHIFRRFLIMIRSRMMPGRPMTEEQKRKKRERERERQNSIQTTVNLSFSLFASNPYVPIWL